MFKWIQGIIQIYGADGNVAKVNESGELNVVNASPTAPPGKTSWNLLGYGDVGSNNSNYEYFEIPNGETSIIQRVTGGAEGESRSKVEAFYDPYGQNGSKNSIPNDWVPIEVIYCDGATYAFDESEFIEYVGNNINRIVLRRKRLESGAREIFGKIEGYY